LVAPGIVEPLKRFCLDTFPVQRVAEDGDLIVLWMDRQEGRLSHWRARDYRWYFDPSQPTPFLAEGWSSPEVWGDRTFAWSNARESRLWVYFPQRQDFILEGRLLPFSIAGKPPQAVQVYVNQRLVSDMELTERAWQNLTIRLPGVHLNVGLNEIRFAYRYTTSPARIFRGSPDTRALAVAYDWIALRPVHE
jgi:hypothetical protein